jgi:hypothetical protein
MSTIIQLGENSYVSWSKTMRCPISNVFDRKKMEELVRRDCGNEFPDEIIERVVETGTTDVGSSVLETIRDNHSGPRGSTFTAEQIRVFYGGNGKVLLKCYKNLETGEKYAAYCAQDIKKVYPKGYKEEEWELFSEISEIQNRGRVP